MTARPVAAWALAAAAVLSTVHAVARVGRGSVDLSRAPPAEVTPVLRERLARLDQDLLLTYAASAEAAMPSDLRGVPRRVETLLRAIEKEGGGRVRIQIVDPASGPGVASYLASVGLAPFRARSLDVDLEVERSVWSSLRIAYGAKGAATMREVTPANLPDLQALIAAHLDLLESPRRPRVALAAPLGFGQLRRSLRAQAELLECDFEIDAKVPEEADVFFWIDPARAEPVHLAALHALLDRGCSVVIAGSRLRADSTIERTSYPTSLPREFGLAAVDAILLEGGSGSGSPLVRSIGSEQDFRPLSLGVHGQANGTLLFAAPTAFEPAAGRLSELGLSMFPLASSSADTWIRPRQGETGGARAPRSTLLALLAPDSTSEPRRGSVVFAASSSPFSDEYLKHEAFAHEALLSVLVRSLGSEERMATRSAAIQGPVRTPELSAARRTVLSAAVTLATPLLVLLAILARGFAGAARARRRTFPGLRLPSPVLLAATAAVSVLLLARFAPEAARLDFTREGLNGLAPETRAILAQRVSPERPVRIEFLFSADSQLPAWLRSAAREARASARRFADAARGLFVVHLEPDEGDAESLTALARDGVLPLDVPSDPDGRREVGGRAPRVYAAIRLVAGDRAAVLRFPDAESFEHLEFRLAHALESLSAGSEAGRGPRIAFVSSAPRLTPAEVEGYQKRGLFAPGGGDLFTQARALLESNDFVVGALDPAKPEVPDGTDLLVCLEPRRDATAMIAAAAARLAGGGRVLLAAQHFGVRSRRAQATGLALALAPEPWFADLDRLYLPGIGIELVREVLQDELHGSAEVETEIEREPGQSDRVRERATSSLFVRATPSGFDRSSPIVRGISELVLECPSRIRVDREKLAEHGISARELISTSEHSWAFDWKGGDLPEDVLRGPRDGAYLGRQPLAMLFEGPFPPPGSNPDLSGGIRASSTAAPADMPAGKPADKNGKLLLLGCSQIFHDGSLHPNEEASGDRAQLLLNAVAALTLPADFANILARRSAPPAIGLVAPRERILWRLGVVGAAPATILLLGFLGTRRKPRRRRSDP